jgi:hypothetical protein
MVHVVWQTPPWGVHEKGGSFCRRQRAGAHVAAGKWKGVTVAVKIVEHTSEASTSIKELRESILSSSIIHPNVVRFLSIPRKSCAVPLCAKHRLHACLQTCARTGCNAASAWGCWPVTRSSSADD